MIVIADTTGQCNVNEDMLCHKMSIYKAWYNLRQFNNGSHGNTMQNMTYDYKCCYC